jgi:hypothetical protein
VAAHEVLGYLQRAEHPKHRELALYALAQTGTGGPNRDGARQRRSSHRTGGAQLPVECGTRRHHF